MSNRFARRRLIALCLVAAAVGVLLDALVSPGTSHRGPQSQAHRTQAAPQGTLRHSGAPKATRWLAPGSNPSVLPSAVLIADKLNNRLIEVDPSGRIVWQFPRPGDLRNGETFVIPDDAFFDASGKRIIATQEDNFTISVIDVRTHRIVYRYGQAGIHGSGPNLLYNPDDALLTADGGILSADIKNCRLIYIRPPRHRAIHQLGTIGRCAHDPPRAFGSPNGAFPMANGNIVVTEINGDWIDVIGRNGKLVSAAHVPGFGYPSDTNEVRPGLFLSVDYAAPGGVETFTPHGYLRWAYRPRPGDAPLDHPSLALPLPNGDFLVNDDYNDRVIVINPRTNRIVWQYGHTNVPGSAAGYLSNPDGVDLAPPHALANRFQIHGL